MRVRAFRQLVGGAVRLQGPTHHRVHLANAAGRRDEGEEGRRWGERRGGGRGDEKRNRRWEAAGRRREKDRGEREERKVEDIYALSSTEY